MENIIKSACVLWSMELSRALERIGLTEGEIKVYLSLLKLGQTTAGPIVDDARVARSKIYDILERLKNKGLVSYIIKKATKYFSATDPRNLLEYLGKKEQEIKEEKETVKSILPELLLQQQLVKEKKIAEVFIGMRGMENAFNVLVNEFDPKEHYYAFGAGKGEDIKAVQRFFARLHEKRAQRRIKSYIIFNESSRGLFPSQERSKLVEAKYLLHSTPAAINIYKDYVIVAILTREPTTFLLRNKEAVDSFKEYFKAMWVIAKP